MMLPEPGSEETTHANGILACYCFRIRKRSRAAVPGPIPIPLCSANPTQREK